MPQLVFPMVMDAPSGTSVRGARWPGFGPAWQGERVTEPVPVEPAGWLTLPDVAERLDVSISKVHQMIRERELLAVRRDGVRRVPAELVANRTVLKHLPGVLNLLHDAGYADEEALRWLYLADDTLPGTPAEALAGDRAREIKRRAQALGF
ncbi:hypothetical protein GCM10027290_38800 [Micromonospora sonneratiae]